MYSLMLIAMLASPALAQAAPPLAIGEQTFRGKLRQDAGLWKWGHITLTDAAIVVETHHFPFRLDTEGIEYDSVSSEFKSSRGLFRGSVSFKTATGSVTFLCPAKQTKALTAALKERTLLRRADSRPAVTVVPERKSETTTTITTTIGGK
jgi:hypothetical protein